MLTTKDQKSSESADTGPAKDRDKHPSDETSQSNPLWQSMALRPAGIQPKLIVSQPADASEQEADRVAEQVMRTAIPESRGHQLSSHILPMEVQRACDQCEEEEEKLQGKAETGNRDSSPAAPETVHKALSTEGQPLDPVTRSFMEERFSRDFSEVRIHTDARAAESARAVRARAYTVGRDVVFNEKQYAPESGEGKRLLAHELAHVTQQSATTAGHTMIQRQGYRPRAMRGRQTQPQIISQPHGRVMIYRLQPGSWHVNWADIHTRVAAIPELAPFTNAFSPVDLFRSGSTRVTRTITLPNGGTARVDLETRRTAGREGATERLGPGHVRVVFNRGAELSVALGLPAGADINPSDVARANADPAQLQRNLDSQVFEVFVHELYHALILIEQTQPTGTAHSALFNDYQSMVAASGRAAAAAAATQVDVELILLIQQMVADNNGPPRNLDPARNAQIIAAVRATPAFAPNRVREWFLNERFVRTASSRAAATSQMSNADLASSYSETLERRIRGRISTVSRIRRPASGNITPLYRRVAAWFDATLANLQPPPARAPRAAPPRPPAQNPTGGATRR